MPFLQLVRSLWQSGLSINNVRFFRQLVCIQWPSRHGLPAALGLWLTLSRQPFDIFLPISLLVPSECKP